MKIKRKNHFAAEVATSSLNDIMFFLLLFFLIALAGLVSAQESQFGAELRQEGATYWLIDLDSTNGVEVRGKRVKRLKLEDGTRFTIGSTEIAFSRELQ